MKQPRKPDTYGNNVEIIANNVTERMIRSVVENYKTADMKWHYEHGLVLQSIFLYGLKSGRDDLCNYVKLMYDSKITPEGEIISYRENDFNLDQINPGKTLFLLLKKYGDKKYRIAIETLQNQLRKHPRTNSGGFWHKQIYPWQMWLDGLYMQGPFYAQYAAEFGSENDFADIVHQFTLIESKARDLQTGFLYHAWDESRKQKWANPQTGCSPHFWGRAMGWYCMALVDVLDFIPRNCIQQYHDITEIAKRLCEPLCRYQDAASGLWFQVLDKGGSKNNYTESSASSMFVYFLMKMLQLKVIPEEEIQRIKKVADKAYNGLLMHKIREDRDGSLHLTGICKVAGLGGNPYRDGSFEYYVNEPVGDDDYKGIGPFILASMQ